MERQISDFLYGPLIRPGVARAAAEHGLDGERVAAGDFAVLRIDRTPPSLESPGYEAPPNEINVRPEPYDGGGDLPAWFDDLSERPLVYVTLGTVWGTGSGAVAGPVLIQSGAPGCHPALNQSLACLVNNQYRHNTPATTTGTN